VRVANPPARDELERFYSFASGYGVGSARESRSAARLRRVAARHAAFVGAHRAPGRLLDVGCGAGFFVAEALRMGWDASGIDLNADLVAVVRERDGLPLAHGRLGEIDLPARSLDALTLWDVLEHVEDPRATLEIARRLLRDGGLVGVSTPNVDGLFPRLSYPVGRLTGYWTHPEPPAHLFQFSTATLTSLLERSGFCVDAVAHDRSPLKYTLAPGGLRLLARHPGRIAYAGVFMPALLAGPLLRRGDQVSVVATAV
jgi:2-polyprenyl-3-methyl-5-hydroxy-6-metoxy-1,4-benzoquinol methylase